MQRLFFLCLLVFVLYAGAAGANAADDVASLRELIEAQNRLLTEQRTELESLGRRVAELEGRAAPGAAVESPGGSAAPASADTMQTAADDKGEIGLEQKKELKTGKEATIIDKDQAIVLNENLDLYGSLRIFTEGGSGTPNLNDGSSRLGMRLGRSFGNGRTVFGRAEWKVNLVDSDSELVADSSAGGGGIVVGPEDVSSALTTRLGYLGARFEDVGEISFGKQWSVYYDVAGWTDNFNVYGGGGLSVYAAGTDGGSVGSGRADNAVIWRNERGTVSYGVQTQLRTASDGADYTGFGGSLIVSPTDAWDIGLAFAGARIEGDFEIIAGDDKTGVATLGARYHDGPWNAAFAVASWKNHEAVFFADDTLIYDGFGAELLVSYEQSERLQFYGGFNYTNPDINDPRVDPDFGLEVLILGASWFSSKESFAYIEGLLSTGEDENGNDIDSVLSLGYRFDF